MEVATTINKALQVAMLVVPNAIMKENKLL